MFNTDAPTLRPQAARRLPMKTAFPVAAALLACGLAASAPSAQASVGVSLSVGQPGFYGQINIGDYGRPQVYAAAPVWVSPAPRWVAPPPPMYLYVPTVHRANWRYYCGRYNACGRPVYFVREDWYRSRVVPVHYERRAYPYEYRDRYHDNYHGHYDHGYGGAPRPPYGGPPPGGPSGPPTMRGGNNPY